MKHLKKFDLHTEFESAQLDPLYVAIDNEHIHYSVNKSTDIPDIPTINLPVGVDGIENTYGYVDLKLPSGTKWAQCNVGATTPCEPGIYFLFGQTYGYYNDFPNVVFDDTDNPPRTSSGKKYMEGETLNPEDDAATALMGDRWRMPTKKEFDELIENTNSSWVTCDVEHEGEHTSMLGRLFVSKIDSTKKLFLPAGGRWDNRGSNSFIHIGEQGFYWTRDVCEYDYYMSYWLEFYDTTCLGVRPAENNIACNVRGVCK